MSSLGLKVGEVRRSRRVWSVNLSAEFHHELDHLIGGFPHAHDLPGGQGNHRIRRLFNVFDQVGIQN